MRQCEAGQGEPSVSTRLGQDDMDDMAPSLHSTLYKRLLHLVGILGLYKNDRSHGGVSCCKE